MIEEINNFGLFRSNNLTNDLNNVVFSHWVELIFFKMMLQQLISIYLHDSAEEQRQQFIVPMEQLINTLSLSYKQPLLYLWRIPINTLNKTDNLNSLYTAVETIDDRINDAEYYWNNINNNGENTISFRP